jgi:hypothetical protein
LQISVYRAVGWLLWRGSAYRFPRGEAVRKFQRYFLTEEECGQKSYKFYVVTNFLQCPTYRRSSSEPPVGGPPKNQGMIATGNHRY